MKYFLVFLLFTWPLYGYHDSFPTIFQEHLNTLQNLDEPNPPQLILFSGTPGMGKTFAAKKLENHFKAIRLSSDETRELFKKHSLSLDLVNDYLSYCLVELPKFSPNCTIILDRSCDRTYTIYESFAKEYGYQTFLIRMCVPRDLVEARIVSRGYDIDWFLKNLDCWWNDYENFGKNRQFDFILENNFVSLISALESKRVFQHIVFDSLLYHRVRNEIISYAIEGQQQKTINPNNPSSIIQGLYLGNQEAANLIMTKKPAYTSDILTLRSNPNGPQNNIRWKGIKIGDQFEAKISDFFDETFCFIEETQKGILIHCKMGVSRSSTIVIAYLMQKFHLPFSIAYAYVKKKHVRTQPNEEFLKQLLQLDKKNEVLPETKCA